MTTPNAATTPNAVERRLNPHEVLFEAGDISDSVCFVISGSLEVLHSTAQGEIVVSTLGAGEVVGEITALIGGRRTATVRAGEGGATLEELSADDFGSWLATRPDDAARIAKEATKRIDQTRVTRVLTELIGTGHSDVVADANELIEWVRLDAGQRLFNQGDEADAAYIVITGRLRLTATNGDRMTLDVSIGRGDIVGELGILENAPRSATATATRDVTLARLSVEAFETMTAKHPSLMLKVFRKIISRVMKPSRRPPHAGMIAIAVLDPTGQPDLVARIVAEIARHGPTLHLDRHEIDRFFRHRGVIDASMGTIEHARLDEFLHEADVAHKWVVLETDPTVTDWSQRALRSADRVVLVTSPYPDDHELQRVAAFSAMLDGVADRDLWIVQSNAPSILRPTMNRKVVELAAPDRILQHRRGDLGSAARIGRLASGTATGLALSGGGGRGLAHIGALQALAACDVTIDALTGSSMGSIVAASMAFNGDADAVLAHLEHGFAAGSAFIDYTLPLVSLAAGKVLSSTLERMAGAMLIEELMLPFACLSTNLTTAQQVVHRRGNLALSLRASVSLPGVFPPVVSDGQLLVDGGVLENLPVGPLAHDAAIRTIIAIDVAPPDGPSTKAAYGTGLSGRTALAGRLRRGTPAYPPMATTVMASMLLGSAQARNAALDDGLVDLYLSLDLQGVKLLDFTNLPRTAALGYEAALPGIREWAESRSR